MKHYYPNKRQKQNIFATIYEIFSNVVRARELIWQMFKRDFLMSYKKSFIGMGWIILAPLVGIISWVFMNATGVLSPGEVDIPYPVYVLLSSTIWGLFMSFYGKARGTLSSGKSFIMQVDYPHEALLFKQALQVLAEFLINMTLTFVILIFFGVFPDWRILLFPFAILPIFFLGSAIGLIIGLVSVVATDISKVVNTLMGFAIYITPVIYSNDIENELLQTVIKYNPLTYLIDVPRDLITGSNPENILTFLAIGVGTFVIFIVALRLFYVSEEAAIEKMI